MSTLSIVLTVSLPIIALVCATFAGVKTMKKTGNSRKSFGRHFVVLAISICLCFAFSCVVSATGDAASVDATTETITQAGESSLATSMRFIGAALSIGLSAIGAGIALAAGAPAAIGAVAEDPKSFGKSIIFVVLGEAVAIYGLIIAFLMIIPTL